MLLILQATAITNHPLRCRKNKMSIPKLHSLLLLLLFLLPLHAISQYTTIQNDQNIIPPFICDHHKNLPHPDLNYNYITGNFPAVFYNHTNLQYLDLSQNYSLGNILDHISRWSLELQYCRLFRNNLSGEFPVISRLSKFPSLQLHSGCLNHIPDGLWKVSSLEKLMMSDNSFARDIPQKLAPKLSILQISNNKFSGQRPTGVCFWTSQRDFRASNDLYNGGNPKDLTSLPNLATILLDGNKLSSELLATVASCNSLNTLNFSRNQVTGQIPEGVRLLKVLTVLDLSRNNVSGQIKGELGRQLVSVNTVTRTIPSQLDSHAFKRSFWENPGLCSDNPLAGVVSCRARSHAGPSSKISSKSVNIAVIMIWLMLCVPRRKDSKWKLTSFETLPFPESTILNCLKDKDHNYFINDSKKVYKIPVNQPGNFVVVRKIENSTDLYLKQEKIPEVEILSKIQHSNIVKLKGYLSDGISTLLIYDYFEKESLDRWLHKNKNPPIPGLIDSVLDWPKRLNIAVGIAEGLSYMHHHCSPAVVHMDLKLSNILLDSDFSAKIANFKRSRFLVNGTEVADTSTSAGSYRYKGPEYTHKPKEETKKTDVYKFGVILLELVTGKKASDTDHLVVWARQQQGQSKADTLDKDVIEPMYLSEMTEMFNIGVSCTKKNKRLSIKEVCKQLLKMVKNTVPNPEPNTRTEVGQGIPEVEGDEESPTGKTIDIPLGPQP